MKKTLLTIMMALLASNVFAASDAETIKAPPFPGNEDIYTVSWSADTDGSFTNYVLEYEVCGYVLHVTTDPGSTAPTANYDITLTDDHAVDIMGGELEVFIFQPKGQMLRLPSCSATAQTTRQGRAKLLENSCSSTSFTVWLLGWLW